MNNRLESVFRRGSVTFHTSSLFFPPGVRKDVRALYAFVRTADDYVDSMPQDRDGFEAFRRQYESGIADGPTGNTIIDSFVELARRKDFGPSWADAFLDAMASDMWKVHYNSLEEILEYVYGSAEVVGLMMASIMGVPEDGYGGARALGRAFQYVNFVRDISEDLELGRVYLPAEDLETCGLASLARESAMENPSGFSEFISIQIARYRDWRCQAQQSFPMIPRAARIAVSTAARMYDYTADTIEADPMVVFVRKVKPPRIRIVAEALGCVIRQAMETHR